MEHPTITAQATTKSHRVSAGSFKKITRPRTGNKQFFDVGLSMVFFLK